MANSLELLEEKFRRVEEASERRVLDEREVPQSELVNPSTQPRKKPSVSMSQFGKQEGDDEPCSPSPSPLNTAASKSTFYHTLANPRSIDSLASENSEDRIRHGEEQHEIQVQRITGRQTLPKGVGILLPRLTRARSQLDYKNMVIDVSVETTTESIRLSSDLDADTTKPLRSRAATVGVSTPPSGFVERAKDFASKLRRKSRS